MRLEQVVDRIANDSEFAAAVAHNPGAALHRADIDLTEGELQALRAALLARKEQKPNGPIGHTWYESRLEDHPGDDQLRGHTWYEAQLGTETA